jgi:hypothetical protein
MAKDKKQKKPSAKAQAAAAHEKAQQEQAAAGFDVSLPDLLRLNEVGRCLPALPVPIETDTNAPELLPPLFVRQTRCHV